MASSSTDLVVITNTLSNLKRLMTSEIENESPSKRVANSTLQLSMNSSEIPMSHPEKKPWSSFLKPIQEKSKQMLQIEEEKSEGNVLMQVENEEIVNQCKEEMKEEMKEEVKEEEMKEEMKEEEVKEEEMKEEEQSVEITDQQEQSAEAEEPKEQQSVEATNPIEQQTTTQEEPPSEASNNEEPIQAIPQFEEPSIQEQPSIPYKEESIPIIQPNSISLSEEPQPTQQTLTLEQQVEKVLEDMDKQATIHQQYKPPSPSLSITPPTPPISFHHLNFVYIPHRGCVDRIRLLISYLNENPQFTYHLPPISSTTLSIPNFMQYMKEKHLPSVIIPILEIHTQQSTPILLLHDQAIFSFLIQTYHLQAENPEKQFIEQNIESTTQFILQELWWYEHSCEKETSDSQKIKLKKQFISTVLFPSLQIINSFLFQLHRNEPEEKLFGIDFALISLLTTLDNQFSIIIDLFIEMKEYYSQIMKQDFITKCNRY